jgi:pyruvate formate-lyase activating enzyme-like uncharacterized protein
MAQQLSFELSNHYAEYINFFDFKGVSFSGGEPFLVYDRLIDYLETIRKNCKPDIYIWLYTNGILTKQDKFKQLRDSGLNEIRFDIGATHYQLEHIKKAKGIIENITIEIPLVPEKTEQIKQLLPQMIEAGVNYLNLHQLRLTNYNVHKLLKNDYTFLHGEHPVVLESELNVLEILDFVDKSELDIGINYCSFQYKNRFQKAGYRNKLSRKIFPDEEITENGYFLNIYGGKTELALPGIISGKLISDLILEKRINKLSLSELIIKHKDFNFLIFDFSGMILEKKTSDHKSNFKIGEQDYFIEKGKTVHPVLFNKEEISTLIELISKKNYDLIPEDDKLFLIWKHVFIEQGFRPYL